MTNNDGAESTRPIQLPTCRKCEQEHWAMLDDGLCIECAIDALEVFIDIGKEIGYFPDRR